MTTLIFYSSTDGHTRKIAETLAEDWQGPAQVAPLADFADWLADDRIHCVVIGASIRYGRFQDELTQTVRQYKAWLNERQTAFFAVNLTARKPGRADPTQSPYVQTFLRASGWQPDHLALFAGKLDYPLYRFFDKQMIRLIMKMTGGCADGTSTIVYTDWQEVLRFSRTVSGLA
jgi:menaquinone-dependent protoporphyrinogen oxidase